MSRRAAASDDRLVELFLDMQAAERGAGENTLAAYRNDLADLAAHLRSQGRGIGNAETEDLRGFLKSLSERGLKPSSVARRLSALRQLFRFLYAEGKRANDPAAVLEGPKRGRSLPKVLCCPIIESRTDSNDFALARACRYKLAYTRRLGSIIHRESSQPRLCKHLGS